MSRFDDAPSHVKVLVENIVNQYFPDLMNAKIKVLYDTKKRKSGGRFVVGRMMKANDLLRHLTVDEANDDEGYDYFMFLDQQVFQQVEDDDQIRIIRHELRHANVDPDNGNYGLVGHEVEDFYDEIRINGEENLRWRERVFAIAASVYDEEEPGEVHLTQMDNLAQEQADKQADEDMGLTSGDSVGSIASLVDGSGAEVSS